MPRRFFQDHPWRWHYDLPAHVRVEAVRLGAREVDLAFVGRLLRDRRRSSPVALPPVTVLLRPAVLLVRRFCCVRRSCCVRRFCWSGGPRACWSGGRCFRRSPPASASAATGSGGPGSGERDLPAATRDPAGARRGRRGRWPTTCCAWCCTSGRARCPVTACGNARGRPGAWTWCCARRFSATWPGPACSAAPAGRCRRGPRRPAGRPGAGGGTAASRGGVGTGGAGVGSSERRRRGRRLRPDPARISQARIRPRTPAAGPAWLRTGSWPRFSRPCPSGPAWPGRAGSGTYATTGRRWSPAWSDPVGGRRWAGTASATLIRSGAERLQARTFTVSELVEAPSDERETVLGYLYALTGPG